MPEGNKILLIFGVIITSVLIVLWYQFNTRPRVPRSITSPFIGTWYYENTRVPHFLTPLIGAQYAGTVEFSIALDRNLSALIFTPYKFNSLAFSDSDQLPKILVAQGNGYGFVDLSGNTVTLVHDPQTDTLKTTVIKGKNTFIFENMQRL